MRFQFLQTELNTTEELKKRKADSEIKTASGYKKSRDDTFKPMRPASFFLARVQCGDLLTSICNQPSAVSQNSSSSSMFRPKVKIDGPPNRPMAPKPPTQAKVPNLNPTPTVALHEKPSKPVVTSAEASQKAVKTTPASSLKSKPAKSIILASTNEPYMELPDIDSE